MSPALRPLLALVVAAMPAAFVYAADTEPAGEPPGRAGRVSIMEGRMQVRTPGEKTFGQAEVNFPITADMEFVTDANARAELQLGGSTLSLDGRTAVTVEALDDSNTVLQITEGSVDLRVRVLGRRENFTVETATGRMVLVEPGAYRIDANDRANPTRMVSFSGRAEIETARGSQDLDSHDAMEINAEGRVRTQRPEATALDDWAQKRESQLRSFSTSRFVSSEIPGYEDLETAGTWTRSKDHGPVWFPSMVTNDWAPYQDGRWTWVAPWGWTWIDSARWGFAPFHYGRWVNIAGRWGWVPGERNRRPVYAPALVGFDGVEPGRFATKAERPRRWVALGPNEVYRAPYSKDDAYLQKVNFGTVSEEVLAEAVWDSTDEPKFMNRAHVQLSHINTPAKPRLDEARPGMHEQMVLRIPVNPIQRQPLEQLYGMDAQVVEPAAEATANVPANVTANVADDDADEQPKRRAAKEQLAVAVPMLPSADDQGWSDQRPARTKPPMPPMFAPETYADLPPAEVVPARPQEPLLSRQILKEPHAKAAKPVRQARQWQARATDDDVPVPKAAPTPKVEREKLREDKSATEHAQPSVEHDD